MFGLIWFGVILILALLLRRSIDESHLPMIFKVWKFFFQVTILISFFVWMCFHNEIFFDSFVQKLGLNQKFFLVLLVIDFFSFGLTIAFGIPLVGRKFTKKGI